MVSAPVYGSGGQPQVSGACTSYYGSSVSFVYQPVTEGIELPLDNSRLSVPAKVLRDGQLVIIREGRIYNVQGAVLE